MKTRPSRTAQSRSGLPPPPAPTARDANPWKLSSPPEAAPHEPRHPRAPGWPPAPRPARDPTSHRSGRLPWIPFLILFFIGASGVQLAIRAIEAGEVESAVGALVIVGMVAFMAVRRLAAKR